MSDITVGDRVQLLDRGRVMTVEAFLDHFGHTVKQSDRCKCKWVDKNELKEAEFYVVALKKLDL